jgi:hypothetical protein
MRLNATFPAFLALAVLLLIPATLLAKPAHRRARKVITPHKQTVRSTSHQRHPQVKHVRARISQTQRRVTRNIRAKTHRSAPPRHLSVSDTTPRKATSADFLKAAAAKPEAQNSPTSRSEEHAALQSRAVIRKAKRTRKTRSAAKAIPVIDVIRPTAERPQLQSVQQEAAAPAILPALYNKRGRLIIPPPLKGSHEILLHQNEVADREGLDRIQNDADLIDMRNKRILVPIPTSYGLGVDDRLPANRRYCRPWTSQFLNNLARAHYARFHTELQINSAVRTVEFQQHLIHINGNAAPAEGDTASPHLTGQAIDIAKHGLSRTEVAWMRGYLLPLIQEGKIDVEEEFQQSCFHISVYKKYLPPADAPRRDLASHRNSEASALATAIR